MFCGRRVVLLGAAMVAATAGSLGVLGSLPTGASVGNAWTAGTAALPASDLAGDGPATGDQAALVGQTACPTSNECFVVGGYLDSAGNTAGSIETISQSSPTSVSFAYSGAPEPTTNPAGDGPQDSGSAHLFAQLFSVSCASPSFCVAVGTYQDTASHDWALVETWQGGSTWTPTVAPEPASNSAEHGPGSGERQVSTLWDVDCYGVGSCVAVGSYGDSDGHTWPMIDTLSAGTWSATTVDVAGQTGAGHDGESSWLAAVSCSPDGFCAAGGGYNDAQHSTSVGILATGWDDHWSSVSAQPPAGVTSVGLVAAVACPPSGSCVALGSGFGSSLIAYEYSETTNEWSSSVVPMPPANSYGTPDLWFNDYLSISCPAAGDCIGSADIDDTGDWISVATVITQTPSGWTSAILPEPSGVDPDGGQADGAGTSVRSLACPAIGSCVAVGFYYDTKGGNWPLAETLSGGTWTASLVPDPAGSGTDAEGDQSAGLFGVGCSSDGSCGAGGSYEDALGNSHLFAARELG